MAGVSVESMWRAASRLAGAVVLCALLSPRASAQVPETTPVTKLPAQVRGVDVVENVGGTLPLDLMFTNAEGKRVRLGEYFRGDKPAVVLLVYYNCPMVCNAVMEKLAETFSDMEYTPGSEFRALYFSFDHREGTDVAHATKQMFLMGYNRPITPEIEAGWEFHTSDATSARQLADTLGFKYRLLENGQFSHPVALFVITPDGRISRYLYGYKQDPRDLKLALMEASQGKLVKTIGERLMNFCYMYDPDAGKYTLQAMRVMQVGGVASMLGVGTLVSGLLIAERIRRRRDAARRAGGEPAEQREVINVGPKTPTGVTQ